ncbi:MAG: hypothetical protein LAT55_03540 [Opitutales bacterium]|nr:hypothetical protein [Opitutales bacterium]
MLEQSKNQAKDEAASQGKEDKSSPVTAVRAIVPADWMSLGLFVLLILVGAMTLTDYGMSWDEEFRYRGGDRKLEFYERIVFGEESYREVLEATGTDRYPGLFDMTGAVLHRVLPFDRLYVGHGLSFFFALVGVAGVWVAGRMLGGAWVGFLAALFLVLMPRYYGHAFFNPKDIPFAGMFIWALVAIWWAMPRFPRIPWGGVVFLGVTIGLTMATRIGGMLLLSYLALAMIFWYACALWEDRGLTKERFREALILAGQGVLVVVLSFLVLLPWWPYGQKELLSGAVETVGTTVSFAWSAPVLFDGHLYSSQDLPWYYLPFHVVIVTPPFLLLAFIPFCLFTVVVFRQENWPKGESFFQYTSKGALLGWALAFPIVFVWVKAPTIYDGIRHFLFLLPVIALLSAWVWGQAFVRMVAQWRPFRWVGPVLLGVLFIIPTTVEMVRLHPYQYTYFNQVVGGLPGAEGNFETEYWGTSQRKAVEWLDGFLRENELGEEEPVVVGTPTSPWQVETFLTERMIFTENPAEAEFLITIPRVIRILHVLERGRRDAMFLGPRLHRVERRGAVFAEVIDRRNYRVVPD